MNLKTKLPLIILIGILIIPAPLIAQTSETAKQAPAIEYMDMIKEDYSFLNAKTVTMIFERWEEEKLKALTNVSYNCFIDKIVYNSLAGCLSMIKSERADLMMTTDITSIYVAQRNPDIKAFICPEKFGTVMMLRASDSASRDLFDAAIKKIKDSGKMDELQKKWIKELPADKEPELTKIEKSAGAETIYVGVSGDMPPLDYIAADGKPAGFNVALLGEISKEIGKNIEIVSLDSQARFAALESKKIDVFFWIVMPLVESVRSQTNDNSAEDALYKKFIVTQPHCIVKTAFLIKK